MNTGALIALLIVGIIIVVIIYFVYSTITGVAKIPSDIAGGLQWITSGLGNDLKSTEDFFVSGANAVGQDFQKLASQTVGEVGAIPSDIASTVSGAWNSLANTTSQEARSAIQAGTDAGESLQKALSHFGQTVSSDALQSISGAYNTVASGVNGAITGTGQAVGAGINTVENSVQSLGSSLQNAGSSVISGAEQVGQTVEGELSNVWKSLLKV